MPILNDKEYKCDFCGGIFNLIRDETWSDEKAEEEYKNTFPGESLNNRDVVCDDCWQKVKPLNA
jgi:DNA-directed RNA polymerase subunit RPC12/RpoP